MKTFNYYRIEDDGTRKLLAEVVADKLSKADKVFESTFGIDPRQSGIVVTIPKAPTYDR